MNKSEFESAKLDLALASTEARKASWVARYTENMIRHVDKLKSLELSLDRIADQIAEMDTVRE